MKINQKTSHSDFYEQLNNHFNNNKFLTLIRPIHFTTHNYQNLKFFNNNSYLLNFCSCKNFKQQNCRHCNVTNHKMKKTKQKFTNSQIIQYKNFYNNIKIKRQN